MVGLKNRQNNLEATTITTHQVGALEASAAEAEAAEAAEAAAGAEMEAVHILITQKIPKPPFAVGRSTKNRPLMPFDVHQPHSLQCRMHNRR